MPTAGIFEDRTRQAAVLDTHGDMTYAEAVAALDILALRCDEIMQRAKSTTPVLVTVPSTLSRLRDELCSLSTVPLPPGGTRLDTP